MIEIQAINYVKSNKKKLIKDFASIDSFPKDSFPISIFMAGSAGAGKTEMSRALIKIFDKKYNKKIVRIDADEIKRWLPQYTGANSDEVSVASYIGVEKLYDYCLTKQQNLILDGTFSNLEKSKENIKRSLKKNRFVEIYYLFQDPVTSWDFTKKRGVVEKRFIPRDFFIDSFLLAQENVEKIKQEFGSSVILNLITKDFNHKLDKLELNVNNVTSYLEKNYTRKELEVIIK